MHHFRAICPPLAALAVWLCGLPLASPAWAADVGPAPAHYMTWEPIALPVSTGAACSDGSPYRFFVNRSTDPVNRANTVVVFEGGGACWDQNSCSGFGKGGLLAASNPKGIPVNYMVVRNAMARLGLSSPFYSRQHPTQKVQTQSWNIVFAPYCTGDVHGGNKTAVYTDADPAQPLTYHHKGYRNVRALADWLATYMAHPDKLLVTGFSAGATGATANYGFIRQALAPRQSALLADSGPIFPAPDQGNATDYPSLPVQELTRAAWGTDSPDGQLAGLRDLFAPTLGDTSGETVSTSMARLYPQDRLGFAVFHRDGVYSEFSYTKFFPQLAATTGALHRALVFAKWDQDIANWVSDLQSVPNTGYYIPWKGSMPLSHCLTVFSFKGTGIVADGLNDVGSFVDNLLDPSQPLIRAEENPR